jgi:hypothetical protein
MNGDRLGASRFSPARDVGGVTSVVVPAQAHLHGDGNIHGGDSGGNEGFREMGLAHQGRAGLLAGGNFLGRAAEVQIDDFSPGFSGHARAPGHQFHITTDQLYDHKRQSLANSGPAHDVRASPRELGAGHHFRRHIRRAKRRGCFSEGQIRDPRHRRDPYAPRNLYSADLELGAHFVIIPDATFLGTLCSAVKP